MNAKPNARPARTRHRDHGTRKSSLKPPRSRAREFALQGLYQYLLTGDDVTAIDQFTRQLQGFHKADAAHYDVLLHGCVALADDLNALMQPLLDRDIGRLSPIEQACIWIGSYELLKCPDIPWRVALDESIELAKDFGGTDGYKYVNGILNGLVEQLRPLEFKAEATRDRKTADEQAPPGVAGTDQSGT